MEHRSVRGAAAAEVMRLIEPAKPRPLLVRRREPVRSVEDVDHHLDRPDWRFVAFDRDFAMNRAGATLAFLKVPVIGLFTRFGLTNSTKPSCTAS
jgi:hypothetical protein